MYFICIVGTGRGGQSLDVACAVLAGAQFGVLSRQQMLACGASSSGIARRLACGKLQGVHEGVYRVPGFGRTWQQSLMAACLSAGPGAAVSHRAAARSWGLEGISEEVVEISAGGHRNPPRCSEVIVHTARLPPCDVCRLGAFPITTVTRTVIDLAAVVGAAELEVALDDALRTRRATLDRLSRRLGELGGRGRPGTARLRVLLDERDPSTVRLESELEARMLRLLRRAGLSHPEIQYVIRDAGRFVRRVDFAYPSHRLAIEAFGYRWHSGRRAWQRDLERGNELQRLGWRELRFSWEDVLTRGDRVAALIREGLV
ncbi:MAG: endonuclease domain-containing protein [Actinomycetota bacterium]|nr:endonuclease domain-containing protein [Actinomycetota bacterium]